MTAPDPIKAIRAYLLSIPAVSIAAGGRVFVPRLPASQATSMPRAAVVLSASGGSGSRGYARQGDQRLDVRSYGATDQAAWALHAEVHEALKALTPVLVGDCWLQAVWVETGAMALQEPDVDWPLVLRVYRVQSAERVAA